MFWIGFLTGAIAVITLVAGVLFWLNRHASIN